MLGDTARLSEDLDLDYLDSKLNIKDFIPVSGMFDTRQDQFF